MTVHEPRSVLGGRQEGRLALTLQQVGNATRPLRCEARAPLQLSRVRADAASADVASFTLLQLGGILSGDRLQLDVQLQPQAAGRVVGAAATQVYRMPQGDASQTLAIQLAEGSRLSWLPEPLILFTGADFRQTTHVTLAAGARLALLDVLAPGRLARGESFGFRRYLMELEVANGDGRLLFAERSFLEPARYNYRLPGILGDYPVSGSLYLLGEPSVAPQQAAQIAVQHPLTGATVLPGDCGLLIRTVGTSASMVRAQLMGCLRQFAPDLA